MLPPPVTCRVVRAGVVEYLKSWEVQRALAQEVADGMQPNTLILLEHPPVYTIGRRGSRDHVMLDDVELSELGISLHEIDRGGQVTFHGPGQLVAYPVLDIREWGGPVKYVRTLERVIIRTLADFGITAGLIEGLTGVWAGDRKIAAIGVKISSGITYHGLALYVNTDLSGFDHIVPCGITDRDVTSMKKQLGEPVDVDLVAYSLVYHFGGEMGLRMTETESSIIEGLAVAQPAVRNGSP
ncbi:MAG: lipoyl(octanoyl) transferase LipB [Dehalococcoidia bacterium]|nr:lipoyl(octanoyl) transferase LipB [Dehalococcoidia bacterium]